METTISLKSLRTDPRHFLNLIIQGKKVIVTEHRRPIVRVSSDNNDSQIPRGNGQAILDYIQAMPKIKTPFPEEDTVTLMKRTRLEYLERKFGYKK